MKIIIFIYISLLALPALSNEPVIYVEKIINTTAELKSWCKNESSMYYLAQDITPYNWTASWWNEGNFLFVKGTWKIDKEEQTIQCSIRRGVTEKYAIWKVVEE
jgi:hypothetical protein